MKVFEGTHVRVFESDGWEYVERKSAKDAVAIVAVTGDRLILTEQFRRPVGARVIDLPAGLVEKFDRYETAKRELLEETGYACDAVELMASSPTSPGITSEIVHLYRAIGPRREGSGGGVEGEDITVHEVPLSDTRAWLVEKSRGRLLIDLKVWAALYFLKREVRSAKFE